MYGPLLHERYGRYFSLGRVFVKAIGHPVVMRALTDYGLPIRPLMRFLLRLMANLNDGRDGDAQDRLIATLERLAPIS